MPISAENKARYPKNWREISSRIRARAKNRCEQCGVPNGMYRNNRTGEVTTTVMLAEVWKAVDCDKVSQIVLTCAHLDHQPENCSDDNLRMLCQRCHLAYDRRHHMTNARRTRERKSGQGALFE